MKVCPECSKDETQTEFVVARSPCRPCINALAVRKRNDRNLGRVKQPKKNAKRRSYDDSGTLIERECGRCRCMLPVDAFNKNPGHTDGYNNVCRECEKQKWHSTADDKRIQYLLHRLKSKAIAINVPFNLKAGDVVVPDVCPVLGIPLIFGKHSDDTSWRDNSPSVDRIIPDLGYTRGNIIVVSYRANRIKNDATIEELDKVASFYKRLTT